MIYKRIRRLKDIFTYVALCLVSLFSAFPLYWALVSVLRPRSEIMEPNPTLIPRTISLDFFKSVFTFSPFLKFFKNSIIVTLSTTVITIAIASMAAHSLARLEFPGKKVISRGILLAYIFPQIVLVVPLFVGIVRLNLANTYFGLILTYITFSFPFATWMLTAFFQTIPKELEEAGLIDGATNFQVFFRITLPLARPGIVASAVFAFIGAWNEFLYALVILNAQECKTLSVGLYGLIGNEVMKWGDILAACIMMIIPILVFFAFVQRHLVHGLTAGAVKG